MNGIIKQKVILVDVDGTLSDNEHRQHWLDKEKHSGLTEDERWDVFFASCFLDKLKLSTAAVVNAMFKEGFRPVIFTGRPERYKEMTREWLNYHQVPFVAIYTRKDDDRRPDHEVKEGMLTQLYLDLGVTKHDIALVLDDRDSVVAMWRRIGLTCFQVAPGDF